MDFAVCGWRYRSEIHLEGVPTWGDPTDGPADVELRLGAVADHSCDVPVGVFVGETGTITVVAQGVGRFFVEGGRWVTADLDSRASDGAIETMVLGPVLAALSYQRGRLPFHTNAVIINGRIVALSGNSGAGKSTLAAVLMQRGHTLVSDDVLPTLRREGITWGLPSNQNLRLWTQSLDYLGQTSNGLRRAADGEREKYFLPSKDKTAAPSPLACVIWLDRCPAEKESLDLNTGPRRVQTLLKAIYRPHLARDFARFGDASIVDLSMPGVQVYEFWRPRGLSRLEFQADMVEALAAEF